MPCLTVQVRAEGGHQQRRGNALAGNVADGDPQLGVREPDEVVVVASDAEGRPAGAGIVEARDLWIDLRKQPLLNVSREVQLSIPLDAVGDFCGNLRCQPAVLEGQLPGGSSWDSGAGSLRELVREDEV